LFSNPTLLYGVKQIDVTTHMYILHVLSKLTEITLAAISVITTIFDVYLISQLLLTERRRHLLLESMNITEYCCIKQRMKNNHCWCN